MISYSNVSEDSENGMPVMIMKNNRKEMRKTHVQSGADSPVRKYLPPFLNTVQSILFFGILMTALLNQFPAPGISVAEAKQNPITQPEGIKEEQIPVNRDLAELSLKINQLSLNKVTMLKELRRLSRLQSLAAPLEKYSQTRTRFEETLQNLKADPDGSRRQLTQLQINVKNTTPRVNQTSRRIAARIIGFDKWIDYWAAEKDDFQEWAKGLGSSIDLSSVQQQLQQLESVVQEAQSELDFYLQPVLEIQQTAGELQISLHRLDLGIDTFLESRFQLGQGKTLLFSPAFFKQFNADLWYRTIENGAFALRPDFSRLKPYRIHIIVVVVLSLVLVSGIKRVRPIINQSSKWRYLSKYPYSSVGFMSSLALILLCSDVGNFWQSLFRASVLIYLWRLSRVIVEVDKRRIIIKSLIGVLLFYGLARLMELPSALERLLVVVGSVVLIAMTVYANRLGGVAGKRSIWLTWLSWGLVISLIVVIIAELMGKSDLSYYIFSSSLQTLLALLMVRVLLKFVSDLLEIFFHSSRIPYFKNNATQIHNMYHPLLVVAATLSLVVQVLILWGIYPSVTVALESLGIFGFTMGSVRLSTGLCIGAVLFLYLAFCFSKIIEITLLDTILPRRKIQRGVQLSITRLSTYTILLIGFLGALRILGFNMTNLTILGGAVGVGIGFGLQAIFNNFASGLILLFERPIKIGDIIMVGTEYGEVKKLGLRATVVETFDNSEIVVPNSALITSNVTNWTLGRRQVRVKVPIGVAYGSDIDRVLEIITTCALEHPRVLSNPKPSTLFIAHGPSSLDFELRAFVPDIDDRMKTLSELNKDINTALDEAGITIPFPQNDLHLKTISQEVQEVMVNGNV